jgi:hypothetical protein
MNIYGFMIVKDEADILAQTIRSLLKFGDFKKIFIFDNLSSDDTLKVAEQFKSEHLIVEKLNRPYSDDLKYDMVYSMSNLFKEDDWFSILDGDELFTESQSNVVEFAKQQGYNCIEHNTIQFYFTDLDKDFEFDCTKPAILQRPYYLLNYGEPRDFRFERNTRLTASLVKERSPILKICPKKLPVYHFQYRSAQQVERRIRNRVENNKTSNNWGHVKSTQLRDYIVPARLLHCYNGSIKEGLPKGANLYKIRDNSAYTMANLNWLKKNNALTQDQLGFFTASKLKRLWRKIW